MVELGILVHSAPEEVRQNPALALASLSHPREWQQIETLARYYTEGDRRDAEIARLDAVRGRLFACDCAARVQIIYQARYPGDERLYAAIHTARAFARGEVEMAALKRARNGASNAMRLAGRQHSIRDAILFRGAQSAAAAAFYAAKIDAEPALAAAAAVSAVEAEAKSGPHQDYHAALDEIAWQRARLLGDQAG